MKWLNRLGHHPQLPVTQTDASGHKPIEGGCIIGLHNGQRGGLRPKLVQHGDRLLLQAGRSLPTPQASGQRGRRLSNREIGERLHLAEGTVENRVSTILGKLDARDRTQAVLKAITGGLI